MFRCCKRNGKSKKNKLGILSSLAIATIIAQAGGAFAITNLSNPTYKAEGSLYNYVYYGKTGDNADTYAKTNDPILFRVLNTKANGKANAGDAENADALLLLSEYDIYKAGQKWDDSKPYGQSWKDDSSIRTMLNKETAGGTLYDCFSEQERARIMETINDEITEVKDQNLDSSDKINWNNTSRYAYGCGLTGEKLFLLSAQESVNSDYGFANNGNLTQGNGGVNDINRIAKHGDAAGSLEPVSWWLRSASSNSANFVACVYSGGSAGDNYSDTDCGVRFALNIPLSSIVYTSDASEGNSTTSSLAPISAVKAKSPAICAQSTAPTEDTILAGASKLTILDDTRSAFQVTEGSVSASAGGSVTLNYTGAQTGEKEFISIIIKNSAGEGLYYGTPKAVGTATEGAAGTVEFTVPEDLAVSDYTVEVLNEQKNGDKLTNYAGVDTVELKVVQPNAETGDGTTRKAVLTATEEENGAGLWMVVADPASTENPLARFTGEERTQTIVFDVPVQEPPITQVYVLDKAGNVSEPVPLDPDTGVPTATVSYNQGKITLTVRDEKAGIAKVDEEVQDPKETTDKGYPTEVTVDGISKEKVSVIVEDAIGNSATLPLTIDNTKPSIEKAYKRIDNTADPAVQKAIITATDEGGAGLWKVVAANNVDGELVYTFEGKANEQQKIFDLTNSATAEVYAVDHAGNISETAVTLAEDKEAPTATVKYNQGRITLEVTDNQSGIAKIGGTVYSDYPASVNEYNVATGTPSVEMLDALGNKGSITLDTEAPTAADAFIRVGSDGKGHITITATDTESGLWKVVKTEDKTADTFGEWNSTLEKYEGTFDEEGPTQTLRFTTSTEDATTRTVYVVDHAGNVSAAKTLTEDNDAPTVTGGYMREEEGGQRYVTITAEDAVSGLYQVLNSDKSAVLHTYTADDPKTVTFNLGNDVTLTDNKVYVVDKAGNEIEVTLTVDSDAPTVTGGYMRTETDGTKHVIITAKDVGSGLCKVLDSTKNAELYTYTADDSETVTFALTEGTTLDEKNTVYVVDKAGNETKCELKADSTKPTARRGYIKQA